jgi:DNA-binding response OmpR family regulator
LQPKKRVLICHDERHVVRLLKANLEPLGQDVVCCYSSRDAIKAFSEKTFDIVLIKREMPDKAEHDLEASIQAEKQVKLVLI